MAAYALPMPSFRPVASGLRPRPAGPWPDKKPPLVLRANGDSVAESGEAAAAAEGKSWASSVFGSDRSCGCVCVERPGLLACYTPQPSCGSHPERSGAATRPCHSDSEYLSLRNVSCTRRQAGCHLVGPSRDVRRESACGRVRPQRTGPLGPQAGRRPDPGLSRRLADSRPDSAKARLPAWHPACKRR